MPRYNRISNPSAINNTTGYVAGGTITRITGLSGPPRTTGVSIAMAAGAFGSFLQAPTYTATTGQTWTGVAWLRSSVARTVRLDLVTYNSGTYVGASAGFVDTALSANVWTQVRVIATLSGSFNQVALVCDFPSAGTSGTFSFSSARMEQVNDSGLVYADGDSSGWGWDGTSGGSTSTQPDAITVTDTGTGSDTATVQDAITVTDTGTGSDSVSTADVTPELITVTETGTGSDTVATEELLADTGSGSDTATVQDGVAVTDTGTGADALTVADSTVTVADTGTGVDGVSHLDVPFTQVLEFREGPIYEVLVVARVPQPMAPPTFIEVDAIEWSSLKYTNELSLPQTLEATCLVDSIPETILQRLRKPHELPTELWVLRDGRQVFAGPLQGWRVTDGESLTIIAHGLLAYLRMWVVTADLVYSQVDQFQIVKGLVDHWQGLEYGNYGIDTTGVTTSGQLRDATYLQSELHGIAQRVLELGQRINGFDIEVDPASRKLQLWSPIKGVDRSSGEDAVVFDARNITSSGVMCSVAPGDLASDGFGTGTNNTAEGTLYSTEANLQLRASYGRSAITGTWDSVSVQATLDDHVQGLIDARAQVLLVPGANVRVTPDSDLTSYGPGDTVLYQLHEQLGVSGAFRLRKQEIEVSKDGQESVTPEFV